LHEQFARTPIFREYNRFSKTGDPLLLRYILSFCNFSKKISLVRPELEQDALRAWLNVEEKLRSTPLPPWINNLRVVMGVLTEGFDELTFLPRHGSGSVAERIPRPGVDVKNSLIQHINPKLAYMYSKPKLGDVCDVGPEVFWPYGVMSSKKDNEARRASRLIFVPKSWKSLRSICMEPSAVQYAQQGVRTWLEDQMRRTYLSKYVHIEDQTYNREAAKAGSQNGRLDTIDLTAASDSVMWRLVAAIFPAKVLKHLHATRTTHVELPDGRIVRSEKFAPMGSATCFPVQTMIYSALLVMLASASYNGRDWWKPGVLTPNLVREALWRFF
jgi:hypothetical protein